jgi:hypothetical protein
MRDVRVGQVISFHIPTATITSRRTASSLCFRGWRPPARSARRAIANRAPIPGHARLDGSNHVARPGGSCPSWAGLIVWLRDPLLRLLTVFSRRPCSLLLALWRIWTVPDDGNAVEEVPRASSRAAPLSRRHLPARPVPMGCAGRSRGGRFDRDVAGARLVLERSDRRADDGVLQANLFPGPRSTFPGDLRDASSGSAANNSDPLDYDDARPAAVTGAWASAFSATRFYQLDLQ